MNEARSLKVGLIGAGIQHSSSPSMHVDEGKALGLQIGYEHSFVHQVADFLEGLSTGKPAGPTFRDALETQFVCDAVLASAKSGAWTKVG